MLLTRASRIIPVCSSLNLKNRASIRTDSEESAKISIERFAEPLRKPEAVLFRQYLDDNPRGKANALYTQNCTARHGAEGRGGASIALANPVYLAIVDWRAQNPVQRN